MSKIEMPWMSCYPGHPACLRGAALEKQARKHPPRKRWVLFYAYPTYEELKRGERTVVAGAYKGFQPTYEELKPSFEAAMFVSPFVFSLPMRN